MQIANKKIRLLAAGFFVFNIGAMAIWLLLGSPLPKALDWRDQKAMAAKKSFITKLEKLEAEWDMPVAQRQRMVWPMVRRLSREAGMEPATVMAVMAVESRFRPWAVSPDGALGLMQLTPDTALDLGFDELDDVLDPVSNIKAGIGYLADLQQRFDGDLHLALAAYNAGPGMVSRHGGIPPFEETQNYVKSVMAEREAFRSKYQSLASR